MLAVTQAILTGTLSNQELAEAINGRLRAIARANAKLSGLVEKSASLEELVRDELWPFATDARAGLAGPVVQLTGDVARNIALVIHELTTNSVKYGALSNDRGAVRVEWTFKDDQCIMFWRERDGPTVTPPAATGYGSRMIKASLAAIGGSIKTEFCSDGFACEFSFRVLLPVPRDNSPRYRPVAPA